MDCTVTFGMSLIWVSMLSGREKHYPFVNADMLQYLLLPEDSSADIDSAAGCKTVFFLDHPLYYCLIGGRN
jgi:hypothetical protein